MTFINKEEKKHWVRAWEDFKFRGNSSICRIMYFPGLMVTVGTSAMASRYLWAALSNISFNLFFRLIISFMLPTKIPPARYR